MLIYSQLLRQKTEFYNFFHLFLFLCGSCFFGFPYHYCVNIGPHSVIHCDMLELIIISASILIKSVNKDMFIHENDFCRFSLPLTLSLSNAHVRLNFKPCITHKSCAMQVERYVCSNESPVCPILSHTCGRRLWSGNYKTPSVCASVCPSVCHIFA